MYRHVRYRRQKSDRVSADERFGVQNVGYRLEEVTANHVQQIRAAEREMTRTGVEWPQERRRRGRSRESNVGVRLTVARSRTRHRQGRRENKRMEQEIAGQRLNAPHRRLRKVKEDLRRESKHDPGQKKKRTRQAVGDVKDRKQGRRRRRLRLKWPGLSNYAGGAWLVRTTWNAGR